MTSVEPRPAGAGNPLLALAVGAVVGVAAFGLSCLIGPKTDAVPALPLAVFVGVVMTGLGTWRMYRHGWRLFGGSTR